MCDVSMYGDYVAWRQEKKDHIASRCLPREVAQVYFSSSHLIRRDSRSFWSVFLSVTKPDINSYVGPVQMQLLAQL